MLILHLSYLVRNILFLYYFLPFRRQLSQKCGLFLVDPHINLFRCFKVHSYLLFMAAFQRIYLFIGRIYVLTHLFRLELDRLKFVISDSLFDQAFGL